MNNVSKIHHLNSRIDTRAFMQSRAFRAHACLLTGVGTVRRAHAHRTQSHARSLGDLPTSREYRAYLRDRLGSTVALVDKVTRLAVLRFHQNLGFHQRLRWCIPRGSAT